MRRAIIRTTAVALLCVAGAAMYAYAYISYMVALSTAHTLQILNGAQ